MMAQSSLNIAVKHEVSTSFTDKLNKLPTIEFKRFSYPSISKMEVTDRENQSEFTFARNSIDSSAFYTKR